MPLDEWWAFERNMEKIKNNLMVDFPDMEDKVLKQHLVFVELLEGYEKDTIYGIEDFLDNKWYVLEWIKLNNTDEYNLNKEQIKKVKSWEFYLWIKIFLKDDSTDTYIILATKKDKFWFGKIWDFFKDSITSALNKTHTQWN